MRRDLKDKGRDTSAETPGGAADTPAPQPETCPRCGEPMGPRGCRHTPAGDLWCRADGLIGTQGMLPVRVEVDNLAELIEADPAVVARQEDLDQAIADFDECDREWNAAQRAELNAREVFAQQVQVVTDNMGQQFTRYPKGSGPRDQQRAEQRVRRAAKPRDEAWQRVIECREELAAAKALSRHQLQPQAV
jgi:hypothetical protein